MTHTVMTFIAPVKREKAAALASILEAIRVEPETNDYVPFRKLKSLHFASFSLHDAHEDLGYGPCLIFENNFDGTLGEYLEDLYRQAAKGLHEIYVCCEGYRAANFGNRLEVLDYLKAHVVRPNAYHVGNTGRSAERILLEMRLRGALETCADQLVEQGQEQTARAVCASLRKSIETNPEFATMQAVGPRQTLSERALPLFKIALIVLVLGGIFGGAIFLANRQFPWILVGLIAVLLLYLGVLRWKESRDKVQSDAADTGNLNELLKNEDQHNNVQNHMVSITIVKPGWLRRASLWTVLAVINLAARAFFTHGLLGGIPSIHFAHWSMINGGRRLLFLSNFDGSWENYLDDFIDKAHDGLTGVWGNTGGFPRTYFLFSGGAEDGPRFKAYARDSMTATNAWYSAYRSLTVQGIDRNSSIREGLPASKPSPEAWLQYL